MSKKISSYIVPARSVSDDYLAENGQRIADTSLEMAREGATYGEIAQALGISRRTLLAIRQQDETFASMLERAMLDGSQVILERLREVPFSEPDPRIARVKVDALAKYLEMRWPDRYGKRLDVTVKTVDLKSALERARERAGLTIEGETVAKTIAYNDVATDCESVDIDDLM